MEAQTITQQVQILPFIAYLFEVIQYDNTNSNNGFIQNIILGIFSAFNVNGAFIVYLTLKGNFFPNEQKSCKKKCRDIHRVVTN